VIANLNFEDQVAAWRTRLTRFPFTLQSKPKSGVDTCRNVDFELPLHLNVAPSMTCAARIGDDLTFTATGSTLLLDPKETLSHQDDALAVARSALGRSRPLLAS